MSKKLIAVGLVIVGLFYINATTDVSSQSTSDQSLLIMTIQKSQDPDATAVANVLQQLSLNVNFVESNTGLTPLMAAAKDGKIAVVRLLIETYTADVNATSQRVSGVTALMLSAAGGYNEVITYLIAHGANTALKDGNGLNAYDYARSSSKKDAAYAFLKASLDTQLTMTPQSYCETIAPVVAANQADTLEQILPVTTPVLTDAVKRLAAGELMVMATSLMDTTILSKLAVYFGGVNFRALSDGNSALHGAIINNNFDAALYLLRAGANREITNSLGLTPFELAAMYLHTSPKLDLIKFASADNYRNLLTLLQPHITFLSVKSAADLRGATSGHSYCQIYGYACPSALSGTAKSDALTALGHSGNSTEFDRASGVFWYYLQNCNTNPVMPHLCNPDQPGGTWTRFSCSSIGNTTNYEGLSRYVACVNSRATMPLFAFNMNSSSAWKKHTPAEPLSYCTSRGLQYRGFQWYVGSSCNSGLVTQGYCDETASDGHWVTGNPTNAKPDDERFEGIQRRILCSSNTPIATFIAAPAPIAVPSPSPATTSILTPVVAATPTPSPAPTATPAASPSGTPSH